MSSSKDSSIRQSNIPSPLSSFIGRSRELAQVKNLLSRNRLLTLIGPGGCGKTRLAIQVAGDMRLEHWDRAWLTEFASLAQPNLVPQAVAAALGIREQTGRRIIESLTDHLLSQKTLLVLDNCEHLVAACAQLSVTLLESCPDVQILATSREPLGVPGEAVWLVPPLSLPERQPWRNPASEGEALLTYEQSEAVKLFVVRSREASANFELTAENGPWVADICRRLDGIPLAIELAAARSRAYSPRQIAERLDDRFQLLTSRLRTAPARHQTLETTLDWSYLLLSETEQKTLQRLAVFAGGWTLEAAEAICTGGDVKQDEMMALLANLVDKSLVQVESVAGERRYRLLETIRQYAQRKLLDSGENERIQEQHQIYFLHWAERAAARLDSPDQHKLLEQFDARHDNLRAALDWSLRTEDAKKGLRLAAACGRFWRLRGYFSEGRARLTAALDRAGAEERDWDRARALLLCSNLAYIQSDYEATRDFAEEARDLCRDMGAAGRAGVAWAHDILGEVATELGDYETAPRLFEEALAIYRALEDERGIADMLVQLAWAAMRAGVYDEAEAIFYECLPLFRDRDEAAGISLVLAGLGELSLRQGRLELANTFLEESLQLRRAIKEPWGVAASLGSLGWLALLQRDFDLMRDRLGESVMIRLKIHDRGGIAWCLEKLAVAGMLQASGLPSPQRRQPLKRSAQILGTAAALREPLGSVIDPADQTEHERTLHDLRAVLGPTAFAAAWAEGYKLPLVEAVDLALAPVEVPEKVADQMRFGGLSPRERETAVLIAQGKSNREIAAAMVVGVKTVETYVTRILNKLGFNSRVQIATWAQTVGLIDIKSTDA